MHQSAEFMAVRADTLNRLPQAFQQYVEKYFAEMDIQGIKHLAAFRVLRHSSNFSRPDKGVAPCHYNDIMHFTGGLPKNMSLGEWIHKVGENTDGVLVFRKSWDDGQISFED